MSGHSAAPGHQSASDVKDKDQVQQIDRVESNGQNEIIKPSYLKVDEFGAHDKIDPKEIALVRKIDIFCLPVLWLMYFFNFLDRNAIANGKLNGLAEDLNLKGTQFNTCVSILFVGYLCGQIPSNMILSRVRPSIYMSGFMVTWSVVTLLSYKAYNFETLLVCRFLLGIVEAPFYPGAVYIMSMLYTRKEIASRMSIFYTGNICASAFSGLIAAGVFGMDGKMGLAGWRWLFIIQGALSLAVAIPSFYLLPDSPLQTRWLSQEQRELAHNRIRIDTTNFTEEPTSVWSGLKQAASDWRTWVFCLMANLHFMTNGFKNFLPTVVNTFGFSTTATMGLTCPPYILSGAVTVLVSWSSGRRNERTWHIIGCKLAAIVGFTLSVATLNIPARYCGIMIFVGATYGVNNLIVSWASNVLGESNEKRAVAIAMTNTFGNLASVYSPYLWPDADAPRFMKAMVSSIAFCVAVIICALGLKWWLKRLNKKMREENPNTENYFVY
ncbi:unnamed protein product [Clonostachys rosea]|uniref:Major facilitator superfamily (MFS) profile domain-containing protein n=1 Tax=Bionectria ochroleuca TaxID=29856 RepID=A0ABY6U988_BIOOC|nr:unnamed protein product [Clonostachys rosea]